VDLILLNPAMSVQPGQSLTVDCQVSYSVGSYWTHWIRQPAGKGLEWIGYTCSGCTPIYKDSLRNKFRFTVDSSSNTVTLNGQNLQPEDSAVYYCAKDSHSDTNKSETSGGGGCGDLLYSTGQALESIPSTSMVKNPQEVLSLSCRGSGFDFSRYVMHWIRQPAGKSLEWMGVISDGGSNTLYASIVDGRIEITRDNSNSMVYLKLSNLKAEDSAVYYCAREYTVVKVTAEGQIASITI
uniref:Ig-like domain-containing protein n=1 Tax=Cyprinodon variegatus TaxID=28743 RepID=A0A3Q2CMD8_CYPVA